MTKSSDPFDDSWWPKKRMSEYRGEPKAQQYWVGLKPNHWRTRGQRNHYNAGNQVGKSVAATFPASERGPGSKQYDQAQNG
jgi:hypothetical protein